MIKLIVCYPEKGNALQINLLQLFVAPQARAGGGGWVESLKLRERIVRERDCHKQLLLLNIMPHVKMDVTTFLYRNGRNKLLLIHFVLVDFLSG